MVEKKFFPRSVTMRFRSDMDEKDEEEAVESAFVRMTTDDGDPITLVGEKQDKPLTEPGFPAERGLARPDNQKPGFSAETAVKEFADFKPGYPAKCFDSMVAKGEKEYTCFNCNKSAPGHTTSDCRRNRGRRFQPRDGARAERFQHFILEKETAMRRIEQDRREEDGRIRDRRDDEARAEREAREDRYRREDRELAERRRRHDRQWEDAWDEKVRVYRAGR